VSYHRDVILRTETYPSDFRIANWPRQLKRCHVILEQLIVSPFIVDNVTLYPVCIDDELFMLDGYNEDLVMWFAVRIGHVGLYHVACDFPVERVRRMGEVNAEFAHEIFRRLHIPWKEPDAELDVVATIRKTMPRFE
jgi:hypothetical protein